MEKVSQPIETRGLDHDPRPCLWCELLRSRVERGLISPEDSLEEIDDRTGAIRIHFAAPLADEDEGSESGGDPGLSLMSRDRL